MEKKIYDYIIIGTGISGLIAALELSKSKKVAIISKSEIDNTNTKLAQGGIAAVVSIDDVYESHINDTLKSGVGICNKDAVKNIIENAPKAINKLTEHGVRFNKKTNSKNYQLGKEGGHALSRIVHYYDFTGKEIEEKLVIAVKKNKNIDIFENTLVLDLITSNDIKTSSIDSKIEQIFGAYCLNKTTNEIYSFLAHKTILATGGIGRLYKTTTNSTIATGDGIAMALRANAKISNMEFIQFHPTAFYGKDEQVFLISEAVRGAGSHLINKNGDRFMYGKHPLNELAPRDIVARGIDHELKENNEDFVYLDATILGDEISEKFPAIYKYCLKCGIDMKKEYIPVRPAAHYLCGGVKVDKNGATNINNLYATGETACTGLHGANRLASNSLLEGVVISLNIVDDILAKKEKSNLENILVKNYNFKLNNNNNYDDEIIYEIKRLKRILTELMGIERNNSRIDKASRKIRYVFDEMKALWNKSQLSTELIELRNMVEVALTITESAKWRKESRGLHYNTDYPNLDDNNFLKDSEISINDLPEVKKWEEN